MKNITETITTLLEMPTANSDFAAPVNGLSNEDLETARRKLSDEYIAGNRKNDIVEKLTVMRDISDERNDITEDEKRVRKSLCSFGIEQLETNLKRAIVYKDTKQGKQISTLCTANNLFAVNYQIVQRCSYETGACSVCKSSLGNNMFYQYCPTCGSMIIKHKE